MAPTIRIDNDVYAWLQSQARPFEDTPNSVLRRVAGLDSVEGVEDNAGTRRRAISMHSSRGNKTNQQAFRAPLLKILQRHGGEIQRNHALKELEAAMADRLTDYDKADLTSGTIRWQKSAEWEVRAMREEGILKPVLETPRGVWALSNKGWDLVSDSSNG